MVPVQKIVPSRITDLARKFVDGGKGDKIQVGRQVVGLSQLECQQLKRAIEDLGGKPSLNLVSAASNPEKEAWKPSEEAPQQQTPRAKVMWGEDDWEFVTSRVARLLLKEPTSGISNLASRIMQQMPENNRRPVHAQLVTELSKRLVEYNSQWLSMEEKVQKLENEMELRKAAPSKEEVLQALSPEEIRERFTEDVLEHMIPDDLVARISPETLLDCIPQEKIVAFTLSRLFTGFVQQSRQMDENLSMLARLLAEMPEEKMRRQTQAIASAPAKLQNVALVGFLPDQAGFVADKFRNKAKIEYIDKNRSHFNSSADVVVLWARFVSHSMQDQVKAHIKKGARLIVHHGGLETVSKEIERALR